MTLTTTARYGLPLMAAGQAQKEITHNEALMLIDAAITPRVEAPPTDQPPANPATGQCWIVGSMPAGAWTGQAHHLAIATDAGWRFVDLPIGATAILAPDGATWRRVSSGWHAPESVEGPVGGSVIDVECRATIQTIIAALTLSGIIISI